MARSEAVSGCAQSNQGEGFQLGMVNGHIMGIVMKELMRRALGTARYLRDTREIDTKASKDEREDFVTTADKAAQAIYVKGFRECFPGVGLVAEEEEEKGKGSLYEPCTIPGRDIYLTIDGIDGTRAYIRNQSHAIGTQIALVENGQVISAWVGDINTREIYGFRPGSKKAHRLADDREPAKLNIDPDCPLAEQYLMLREDPRYFGIPAIDKMNRKLNKKGLFKNIDIQGGSIGIMMARLWKGEVGATILEKGTVNPWDIAPVVGISQHLGFVTLIFSPMTNQFETFEPLLKDKPCEWNHHTLMVHRSRLPELARWMKSEGCK